MPRSADPCRPVDGEADVVRRPNHRLTGMHTHPHTHTGALRPSLRRQRPLHLYRRGKRIAGAAERHEERVPLRVDLAAAVTGTRGAHQTIVTAQNLRVALTKPAKQARGTLDISEQERDRSARQIRHGAWLRPTTTHVKAAMIASVGALCDTKVLVRVRPSPAPERDPPALPCACSSTAR